MRTGSHFNWWLLAGLFIRISVWGMAALVWPAYPGANLPPSKSETGFVYLFSKESLKDWRQCGPGRFVMTNGIATGQGGMGLWWFAGRQFTNFVLRGEFVQEQDIADSGVFVRFPDPGSDPWVAVHKGHEVEIGDPAPKDPTWRTGSIYPFKASTKANTKPVGQWNEYEIICTGQSYTVLINGEVVTQWTDPAARTTAGYVGLLVERHDVPRVFCSLWWHTKKNIIDEFSMRIHNCNSFTIADIL